MNELLLSFMMLWTPADAGDKAEMADDSSTRSAAVGYEKPPLGPDGIIPPNCTINPWTGKWTCHKWPKEPKPVVK